MAKRGRKPDPRHLNGHDHEWFHHQLHQEAGRWDKPSTIDVAHAVVSELWNEIEAALPPDMLDSQSIRIVRPLAIEGGGRHAAEVIDALGKVRATTPAGKEITIPAYVGIREPQRIANEDGSHEETRMPVQAHLLDLAWERFREVMDREQAVLQGQESKVELLGWIWTFRDVPGCKTPREAMLAKGINPDDIDLRGLG